MPTSWLPRASGTRPCRSGCAHSCAAAEERGLIDAHPGWTADEVAAEVGQRVPDAREPLDVAARTFDEVRYGGASRFAGRVPIHRRRGRQSGRRSGGRDRRLRHCSFCPWAEPHRRRGGGSMSAPVVGTVPTPPATPGAESAAGSVPPAFDDTAWDRALRWRPTGRGLAIAALLLLALVVLMLTTSRRTGYLDPAAVDRSGSRAVANVLADQGVRVTDVRTTADVAANAQGATLLVTDSTLLTTEMISEVLDAGPARLVLIDPLLAPPLSTGWPRARRSRMSPVTTASCRTAGGSLPSAPAALSSRAPVTTRVPGSLVARPARQPGVAAVVVIPARAGRPEVVLLGSAHPLTNGGFDAQGNASLALSLLGSRDELVWWRPVCVTRHLPGRPVPRSASSCRRGSSPS